MRSTRPSQDFVKEAAAEAPDRVILCFSQPSLAARDERHLVELLTLAATAEFACAVAVVRLEGQGTCLVDALRLARDQGARLVRVVPIAFPMAANMWAWLPGAIAHFTREEAGSMAVEIADPPSPGAAARSLVRLGVDSAVRDAKTIRPRLGSPGWDYLPDHETHVLVCSGPRCAFQGSGTLLARLKLRLAQERLADRCLVTSTGCLFPCNQGPVVALYPRGTWFRVPDEPALDRLVTDVIGGGGDAPELRLAERPGGPRECLVQDRERKPACAPFRPVAAL